MKRIHVPEINVDENRVVLVLVAIGGFLILLFFVWLWKFTETNKSVGTNTAEIVISTLVDLGDIPWTSSQGSPIAVIYCDGKEPIFLKSANQFVGGEILNCGYYNTADVSPQSGGNFWDQSPRIFFRPHGTGE